MTTMARRLLLPLLVLVPTLAYAAPEMARVELNAADTESNKCRLTFVIENKTDHTLESLKLDLVTFDPDGIASKRLTTEMGPVRAAKTIVRIFLIDGECSKIGSVLINDVTGCTPGDVGACLDGLVLSSRVKGVRLYK
jgi:hypothetical protein